MENSDKIWIGKKVFVKVKNSNRAYSGLVLNENDFSITLRDIVGHIVQLNLSELSILQEEK